MVARPSNIVIPKLAFQGPVFDRLILPFAERRWEDLDQEYLVEGPTGTGKSVGLGFLFKMAMRMFPGCNLLVMRRVKADLGDSFMQMWEEEIMDWDDPWDRWMLDKGTGRIPTYRSRVFYEYPNGAKLWCAGMNQWPRFKSKAYDLIWCMEMTEFEESQIEGLHTRRRARSVDGKPVPFGKRMLLGDVNPEYPQHWANQRALKVPEGRDRPISTRIKTTLRDNPGYFNLRQQRFTEMGQEYLDGLRDQIRDPAKRQRYIEGIWTAASGQILEWSDEVNLFDGKVKRSRSGQWRIDLDRTHPVLGDSVELIGFAGAYDWGSAHAGTLQVWGFDAAGRMYLVEEVYHSGKALPWWGQWAADLKEKYDLQFIVCDSAAKDSISYFNLRIREVTGDNRSGIARPCKKRQGVRQESNLEVLTDLFCLQKDGAPGVFVSRTALAHAPDPNLAVQRLAEEIPQYVYAEFDPARHSGRPEDKPDRRVVDDGLDALAYMRVEMLGGRRIKKKITQERPRYDTTAALLKWKKEQAA